MARIKTLDGDYHIVDESKERIDEMMGWMEVLDTGILKLGMKVNITSFKNDLEETRQEIEPCTFLKQNIVFYS